MYVCMYVRVCVCVQVSGSRTHKVLAERKYTEMIMAPLTDIECEGTYDCRRSYYMEID